MKEEAAARNLDVANDAKKDDLVKMLEDDDKVNG